MADNLFKSIIKKNANATSRTGYGYNLLLLDEEKFFNPKYVEEKRSYVDENWHLAIVLAAIYCVVIFALKAWMEKRPKYDLRLFLILWNVGLSLFSIAGAVRFWPEFVYSLQKYGFEYSICNLDYVNGVTGFWTYLFIMSKIPELIDTIFIVLRKQELIFLHYYHHATVLMYGWFCYRIMPSTGRWFIAMNYLVHAVMYSYYALKAMRFYVPKQISLLITSMQLIQMVIGCYVNYMVWQIKKLRPTKQCLTTDANITWSFIMYFSYFLLFAKFFLDAYVFKTKKWSTPTKGVPAERNGKAAPKAKAN